MVVAGKKVHRDMLADARLKMQAALADKPKPTTKGQTKYELDPVFITYVVKNGKNQGKKVVKVGFWAAGNIGSTFTAAKLYGPHVEAILACVDNGGRETLEAMLAALKEKQGDDDGEE